MIYTLTFSPSIDYFIKVKDFESGKINRAENYKFVVGGKGINVSLILNDLKQITSVDENIANYSDHQDVSLYFPKYLKETVNMLIKR